MSTDQEEQSRSDGNHCTCFYSSRIVIATEAVDAATEKKVQVVFEDKHLLAKGGWATVFRATLIPCGKVIAIKQVKETSHYKADFMIS